MSVLIDEDCASVPRPGLAGGFAEGPPGGGAGNPAEIWRRLWFTLGALIVYRIGSYLPLPGLDLVALSELRHISFYIGSLWIPDPSIVSLGIMPYVSAFIIVELAKRIVPRLGGPTALEPADRRKLNQYARILTVALAALQAMGVATGFESLSGIVTVPPLVFDVTTVLTLVAGAIFVMWLAEQITVRGLGNGALVVLACGIVSQLPFAIGDLITYVRVGELDGYGLLAALLLPLAIVALVVVVERAVRVIAIRNPGIKAGIADPVGRYAYLSLKLNPAGMLAPLAASVLAAPVWGLIFSLSGGKTELSLVSRLANAGIGYVLVNGLLIVLFAIFFGLAAFDPERIAKKLKDCGGWIPGFRPGENTADYLRRMQVVFALVGAIYLIVVWVLPEFVYGGYLPVPLGGFQFLLLAWVMVRILDQMRPYVRA